MHLKSPPYSNPARAPSYHKFRFRVGGNESDRPGTKAQLHQRRMEHKKKQDSKYRMARSNTSHLVGGQELSTNPLGSADTVSGHGLYHNLTVQRIFTVP